MVFHLTGSPTRAWLVLWVFFTAVYSEPPTVTGMKYTFIESRLSDCVYTQTQDPDGRLLSPFRLHLALLSSLGRSHPGPVLSHLPRPSGPPAWAALLVVLPVLQVSSPCHYPLMALSQRTANSPLHPLTGLCPLHILEHSKYLGFLLLLLLLLKAFLSHLARSSVRTGRNISFHPVPCFWHILDKCSVNGGWVESPHLLHQPCWNPLFKTGEKASPSLLHQCVALRLPSP